MTNLLPLISWTFDERSLYAVGRHHRLRRAGGTLQLAVK
jgi:hypothetical protein